jgi:uncharacterized iron-regulated membrane protein
MRQALLWIHRWIGIVLGLYILVMGITGGVLVLQDQASAAFRVPKVIPTNDPWMDPDQVADKIRTAFPDMHLHTLYWPENSSSPWFAEIKKGEIGVFGETAHAVYLHPSTGQILHVHNYGKSVWRWLQVIHINLAFGRSGRALNSYLGLAALFSVLTGLLLWLPSGKVSNALWTINWSAGSKRLIWELHQVAGIYSLVFLSLFCSTGAYFGWRAPIHRAIARYFPMALFNKRIPPVPPMPNATPQPISTFLASVKEQVPNYPVTRVLFPEAPNQPIRFVAYEGPRTGIGNANNLFYNPFTGELLRADLARDQLMGDRIVAWITVAHVGAFGNRFLKYFWLIGAMSLPLMAITGAIIFVNKSGKVTANNLYTSVGLNRAAQ